MNLRSKGTTRGALEMVRKEEKENKNVSFVSSLWHWILVVSFTERRGSGWGPGLGVLMFFGDSGFQDLFEIYK